MSESIQLEQLYRRALRENKELEKQVARLQRAQEHLQERVERLEGARNKLKEELRMYSAARTPDEAVGLVLQNLQITDPMVRKEFLRLLNRKGFQLWVPREMWGGAHDEAFRAIADRIAADGRTLLGRDRLYTLWQAVLNLNGVDGRVGEVGVYRGGSTAFLSQAFTEQRGAPPIVYAIDTFAGHPPAEIESFELQKAADFSDTSFAEVQEYLRACPSIELFRGAFAEVALHLPDARYALVHLDVDLYRPTAAALEYFAARLQPRGVIVVDDYLAPQCVGVTRAVQEFLSRRTDFQAWCLMTEQVVLVRVNESGSPGETR